MNTTAFPDSVLTPSRDNPVLNRARQTRSKAVRAFIDTIRKFVTLAYEAKDLIDAPGFTQQV